MCRAGRSPTAQRVLLGQDDADQDQQAAESRVVVCHSLDCALWLRAAQTLPAELRVTRVLLVSDWCLTGRTPVLPTSAH